MSIKPVLIAIALTLLPGIALAMCGHDQKTMSCAEGSVWDNDKQTCTPATSS